MWTLTRIALYPVKSLDPVFVEKAELLPGGALRGDRQFALFDQAEHVINGKKYPAIHQIRAVFDLAQQTVTLSVPATAPDSTQFQLSEQTTELENWFSEYFNQRVTLKENTKSGFPDDLAAPGPTIISTQTYEELARWFPEITVDELRLRFRANLEFTGDLPFCEDQLYSAADPPVLFQVGPVTFAGSNPCKRCVVPSRNPMTGTTDAEFMKTFIRKRKETFPTWAPRELFQ
ncbi:MAG: MOSC N-terminal beta barrel domain-containing protein, partial [Planctomycetaceae bacterium]|nr:MOSC N-terminal beta barrel domain-containing protein [Planctomycetaceae bacterium]